MKVETLFFISFLIAICNAQSFLRSFLNKPNKQVGKNNSTCETICTNSLNDGCTRGCESGCSKTKDPGESACTSTCLEKCKKPNKCKEICEKEKKNLCLACDKSSPPEERPSTSKPQNSPKQTTLGQSSTKKTTGRTTKSGSPNGTEMVGGSMLDKFHDMIKKGPGSMMQIRNKTAQVTANISAHLEYLKKQFDGIRNGGIFRSNTNALRKITAKIRALIKKGGDIRKQSGNNAARILANIQGLPGVTNKPIVSSPEGDNSGGGTITNNYGGFHLNLNGGVNFNMNGVDKTGGTPAIAGGGQRDNSKPPCTCGKRQDVGGSGTKITKTGGIFDRILNFNFNLNKTGQQRGNLVSGMQGENKNSGCKSGQRKEGGGSETVPTKKGGLQDILKIFGSFQINGVGNKTGGNAKNVPMVHGKSKNKCSTCGKSHEKGITKPTTTKKARPLETLIIDGGLNITVAGNKTGATPVKVPVVGKNSTGGVTEKGGGNKKPGSLEGGNKKPGSLEGGTKTTTKNKPGLLRDLFGKLGERKKERGNKKDGSSRGDTKTTKRNKLGLFKNLFGKGGDNKKGGGIKKLSSLGGGTKTTKKNKMTKMAKMTKKAKITKKGVLEMPFIKGGENKKRGVDKTADSEGGGTKTTRGMKWIHLREY